MRVRHYRIYGLRIIMASLLSLLLSGCASSKPSKKESEQEKQTILNYLHKQYPEDTFRIQRYYISVPTFPQNTKIFLKRDDYKYATYYVLSQKYNHSFDVDFKWDDTWSQVTIRKDNYPIILVAQAQQQRIAKLALPYAMKSIVGVAVDLEKIPDASSIKNITDAHALLDKAPNIDMSHVILVTVPNATDEATLLETAQKIQKHIAYINRKGDKKSKSTETNLTKTKSTRTESTEISFYSDDQLDVSEITLDLSKSQSIRDSIRDVETYYRIDEPYYQVIPRGRSIKGKRFGM